MHENSKLLFQKYASALFKDGMKVLEIGPDGFPSTYQGLIANKELQWDTLDIFEDPRLTFQDSDPYSFAVQDDSYDIVLAGQVIEHVKKPWIWLPELARVVKQGGYLIVVNPVSWPYHEAPVDCWRIYPEGMKALCEDSGLIVELSKFESLEAPGHRLYVPGMSPNFMGRRRKLLHKLLGTQLFPFERAYDTITIASKP